MSNRKSRRRTRRRTRRINKKKRRNTRRRKGGVAIDFLKLRPGMVVRVLNLPGTGDDQIWQITNMHNNSISYDILVPIGHAPDKIPMVVISIMGIEFELVEKAKLQSLLAARVTMKSKKRKPTLRKLALSNVSTLDRKLLKEHMPGVLDPAKINYKGGRRRK